MNAKKARWKDTLWAIAAAASVAALVAYVFISTALVFGYISSKSSRELLDTSAASDVKDISNSVDAIFSSLDSCAVRISATGSIDNAEAMSILADGEKAGIFRNISIVLSDGMIRTSTGSVYHYSQSSKVSVSDDPVAAAIAGKCYVKYSAACEIDGEACTSFYVPLYLNNRIVGAVRGDMSKSLASECVCRSGSGGLSSAQLVRNVGDAVCPSDWSVNTLNIFDYLDSASIDGFDNVTDYVGVLPDRADPPSPYCDIIIPQREGFVSFTSGGSRYLMRFTPVTSKRMSKFYVVTSVSEDAISTFAAPFRNTAAIVGLSVVLIASILFVIVSLMQRKRIKSLKNARMELQLLTANVPGGVCRYSADAFGTLGFASDGFIHMLGYTEDEFRVVSEYGFYNLVYKEDRAAFSASVSQQLRKGNAIHAEFRAMTKSGAIKWLALEGQCVADNAGRVSYYAILSDIDEEKKSKERARLSEERYRIVLREADSMLFEWDPATSAFTISDVFQEKFGYAAPKTWPSDGSTNYGIIYPDDIPAAISAVKAIISGSGRQEIVIRVRKNPRGFLWCKITMSPLRGSDGRTVSILGMISDVDRETRENESLRSRSMRDSLSGLLNKGSAERLTREALEQSQTSGERHIHVYFMVDLDNFKGVNDTYGHLAGDMVIRSIAHRIASFFRSGDIIGRTGGDEFAILLKDIPDRAFAEKKASELVELIREPIDLGSGTSITISCSVGAACSPFDAAGFGELYVKADKALYEAKRRGRNGFSVYTPDLGYESYDEHVISRPDDFDDNTDDSDNAYDVSVSARASASDTVSAPIRQEAPSVRAARGISDPDGARGDAVPDDGAAESGKTAVAGQPDLTTASDKTSAASDAEGEPSAAPGGRTAHTSDGKRSGKKHCDAKNTRYTRVSVRSIIIPFAAWLAIAAVALIYLCTAYRDSLSAQTRSDCLSQLDNATRQISYNIDSLLSTRITALESLSSLLGTEKNLTLDGARERMKTTQSRWDFLSISLISSSGMWYGSEGQVLSITSPDYVTKARLYGDTIVSSTQTVTDDGVVTITLPVKATINGITFNVLTSSYSTKDFGKLLSINLLSTSVGASIIDSTGAFVVRYNAKDAFLNSETIFSSLGKVDISDGYSLSGVRANLSNGSPGVIEYTSDGKLRILSYKPLQSQNWFLCASIDSDVLDKITDSQFYQVFAAFLIAAAIALVMTAAVAAANVRARKALERIAYVDLLTAGNNYQSFVSTASERILSGSRPYALLFVNVIGFRLFNDRYGRDSGDELLRRIYAEISSRLRRGEAVGRLESDKFAILFEYNSDEELERRIIELYDAVLALRSENSGVEYGIRINSGVFIPSGSDVSVHDMLRRADIARKQLRPPEIFAVYDERSERELSRIQDLTSRIKRSLSDGEFTVYLQPQKRLSDGATVGAEALVRWKLPDKGMILPADFLPIAERTGFITEIDLFVFEKVCEALKRWSAAGRHIPVVSFNLSRAGLDIPDLLERYKRLLFRYGIPGEHIVFEFSERIILENSAGLRDFISELHGMGCRCAIDDFGSGRTSLNLLTEIRADELKLDRTFFELRQDPDATLRSRAVVSSVVALAKSLGLRTYAEGVETQEQQDFLSSCGCDYIQGFLNAYPMPIEAFEHYYYGKNI